MIYSGSMENETRNTSASAPVGVATYTAEHWVPRGQSPSVEITAPDAATAWRKAVEWLMDGTWSGVEDEPGGIGLTLFLNGSIERHEEIDPMTGEQV